MTPSAFSSAKYVFGSLLALLLLWTASAPAVQAQQSNAREATKQRLNALKEQIQRDQERLSETAEAEEASQKTLRNLKREISLREELAATYQRRLRQLSAERDSLRRSIKRFEGRLDKLRAEYQERAIHAYKYGRLHDIGLILAARSINQMLIRVRYLHRFADQRRDKLSDIKEATREMEERREELDASQERTKQLLAEVKSEQRNLRRLRNKRQGLIQELRAQRSTLKEKIEEKRSAAQQLEAQIRRMVAAEESKRNASGRTPAERAAYANLSASFEENRGQLPWPAEGVVTETYGDHFDPTTRTTTRHPGILIATNPQEQVRCVFDGTVTGIDFVPGYGTYLVVRHGDYLSVYSNFSMLYVSEGQKVEAGQLLGRAGTESEPRGAGVFFAVFDKNVNKSVDPMKWLRSR